MRLDDFVETMQKRIGEFKEYWEDLHDKELRDCPMCMLRDEWFEQFLIWDETREDSLHQDSNEANL